MATCDAGVYGLAVMGLNLSLNICSRGFRVCVCNRTAGKIDTAVEQAQKEGLSNNYVATRTIPDFAGAPVDALIAELLPFLEKGDCLVDGGNEFFENTERREKECAARGILYMGLGVSGGEEGARYGPSLMPGGSVSSWELMKPILVRIAAKIDPSRENVKRGQEGGTTATADAASAAAEAPVTKEEEENACVTHVGPGGAGHYVKMVHNGIEYGDMQLIAETYFLLKYRCGLTNPQMHDVFFRWNEGELKSYLIEITAKILIKKDSLTTGYLLDQILGTAGSKGTGKWTVQQAAEAGVAVPTIATALDIRYVSGEQVLRERLSEKLASEAPYASPRMVAGSQKATTVCSDLADIEGALLCGKICCYAQGMQLLATVSRQRQWNLNLAEICRIWKGGCIIRAQFLDTLARAFIKQPDLQSVLLDDQDHGSYDLHSNALQPTYRYCNHYQTTGGQASEKRQKLKKEKRVVRLSIVYYDAEGCLQLKSHRRNASKEPSYFIHAKECTGAYCENYVFDSVNVTKLIRPRRIMIVIEAGKPVETLISHFLPMLDQGDCLVDAGNEFHETTQKREQWLATKGVLYMDVGLCTGEGGARSGPPLTPGGSTEAWKLMEPIFVHISGKIDPTKHVPAVGACSFTVEERQNACVTHLGPAGAGHYVKMIHNGIAYGDMQLIAEAYHFLRYAYGQTNDAVGRIFERWNQGELRSYLLGITTQIVTKKDVYTGGHLVDFVVDAAGARGTGKWTVQEAADLGIAVPTIAAALDLRYISSNVSLREKMNCIYAPCWPNEGAAKFSREKIGITEEQLGGFDWKMCGSLQEDSHCMHIVSLVLDAHALHFRLEAGESGEVPDGFSLLLCCALARTGGSLYFLYTLKHGYAERKPHFVRVNKSA